MTTSDGRPVAVSTVLGPADLVRLRLMRDRAVRHRDDWAGWPTAQSYEEEIAAIDRILESCSEVVSDGSSDSSDHRSRQDVYLGWRSVPPLLGEVRAWRWWWNRATDGSLHVLQLDVEDGTIVDVDLAESSDCGGGRLDPDDWPGQWAPCLPPGPDAATRPSVARVATLACRLLRLTQVEVSRVMRVAPLDPGSAAVLAAVLSQVERFLSSRRDRESDHGW